VFRETPSARGGGHVPAAAFEPAAFSGENVVYQDLEAAALAQRRQANREAIEAMVQILANKPGCALASAALQCRTSHRIRAVAALANRSFGPNLAHCFKLE
jgi:hypothetical protein